MEAGRGGDGDGRVGGGGGAWGTSAGRVGGSGEGVVEMVVAVAAERLVESKDLELEEGAREEVELEAV